MEKSWLQLVEYIKEHPFTEMKIIFKEGKPFFAEEVKETIKFS